MGCDVAMIDLRQLVKVSWGTSFPPGNHTPNGEAVSDFL